MSGLEIVRLTGDPNTKVFRYTSAGEQVDTGLNWPRYLKQTNGPPCQQAWNGDGTLLCLARYNSHSDDRNPATGVIIDVTGKYSGGVPWRVIRATGDGHFSSETYANGGAFDVDFGGIGWFWDTIDPMCAFLLADDGQIREWFPIGENGESPSGPGLVRDLYPAPTGSDAMDSITSVGFGQRHYLQQSHDGLYHTLQGRLVSTGKYGGRRINL